MGIIIIFLLYSMIGVYGKNRNNLVQKNKIDDEIIIMERKNAETRGNVARLESQSGQEEEIRKKFNVAKPGERILIIVDKNTGDAKINKETLKIGIFTKMWRWVKNLF